MEIRFGGAACKRPGISELLLLTAVCAANETSPLAPPARILDVGGWKKRLQAGVRESLDRLPHRPVRAGIGGEDIFEY
jgi:hypothetical protein